MAPLKQKDKLYIWVKNTFMQKPLFSLLLMLMLISPGFSQNILNVQCKGVQMLEQGHFSKNNDLNFRSSEHTDDYDINYHRLEWTIDPAQYYIKGTVTSFFIPKTEGFNQINFDLSSELQVNTVRYKGKAVNYNLTEDDILEIYLPLAIPAGQLDSVSVTYGGAPEVGVPFESFVQSTHGAAGDPIIWTLSEPFGAKNWWPCKQTLTDKIDSMDVFVRTDSQYRAASNGVLAREIEQDDQTIYHWKHRYPITTYLVAIAVTNYRAYSEYVELQDGRQLEILNYVYPESYDAARIRTPKTIQMIELFEELFGPYPFAREKYGHAQFGFPGGMEHQTMSFMVNFQDFLIAHELAHQWFGDKVTCGTWNDIWVNEGFAHYAEMLAIEADISRGNVKDWLANTINQVTLIPGGAVYFPEYFSEGRIFNFRLSYRKGALILHMLRWILGDEDFYQGLKNYLADEELAYGYAIGEDVKYHLEQQSGKDLDEFFADWYYGEGYPSYTLTWSQSADGRLTLTLDQETSSNTVDFFELPVPVKLSGKDQEQMLVLDHQFSGQSFSYDIPFEVGSITIDPDFWLISRDNQVVFTTSSEDLAREKQAIQLAPNPADDQLFIQMQDPAIDIEQVELLHASGRMIRQLNYSGGMQAIDLTDLPRGAYFLRIKTGNGIVVEKFLKK